MGIVSLAVLDQLVARAKATARSSTWVHYAGSHPRHPHRRHLNAFRPSTHVRTRSRALRCDRSTRWLPQRRHLSRVGSAAVTNPTIVSAASARPSLPRRRSMPKRRSSPLLRFTWRRSAVIFGTIATCGSSFSRRVFWHSPDGDGNSRFHAQHSLHVVRRGHRRALEYVVRRQLSGPDPLAARVDPYTRKQRVIVMTHTANEHGRLDVDNADHFRMRAVVRV